VGIQKTEERKSGHKNGDTNGRM